MTDIRWQFSTGSAWGEAHLPSDAIVAYVDDELSPGARRRALSHLAGCRDCGAEVVAQTQARLALRAASAPCLPSSLLSSLRAIPHSTELPAAPAGLAVGPSGELVMTPWPARPASAPRGAPARRWPRERRARLGAGAVVSGLALGALMVSGTPSADMLPGSSPSGLPGSTLDARLRLDGGPRDTASDVLTGVPVPAIGPLPEIALSGPAPSSPRSYELARLRRAHQQVR